MRKQFSDFDRFFEDFKQLPEYFSFEKAQALIYNPYATYRIKGKRGFNFLKIILMTSAFLASVVIFYFWFTPNSIGTTDTKSTEGRGIVVTESTAVNKTTRNHRPQVQAIGMEADQIAYNEEALPDSIIEKDESVMRTNINFNKGSVSTWPRDTVIDKRKLFVYLTKDELSNLGVFLYPDSMYYFNKGQGRDIKHTINAVPRESKFTTFDFTLVYVSDTACTTYRWGHKFYRHIDLLVPVVIKASKASKILWFKPNASFFDALPQRYRHLSNTYFNLRSLKRMNPDHQFVNYWIAENNVVLDKINYLTLSKDELQKIGVGIFKDSISLQDPTRTFWYILYRRKSTYGANRENAIPETPNMFPAMITDIKGLNQGTFGRWTRKRKKIDNQVSPDVFNTLVPVYLPVSDYITQRKYSLILWYHPSDEFLNALPARYRKDLKTEIEYIKSDAKTEKPATCTYFEVCKSTLKVDNLKVYPNPASERINIEFSLNQETNCKISLVNISGIELRLLLPQTRLSAGRAEYSFDLSDVIPGIYILSIKTTEGFKTQRVIVSR